jgi:hypothetical protein
VTRVHNLGQYIRVWLERRYFAFERNQRLIASAPRWARATSRSTHRPPGPAPLSWIDVPFTRCSPRSHAVRGSQEATAFRWRRRRALPDAPCSWGQPGSRGFRRSACFGVAAALSFGADNAFELVPEHACCSARGWPFDTSASGPLDAEPSSRRLARSAAMEAWKSTWYEAIGKSAVNAQKAARVAQFPSSSADVKNRWP